MYLQWSEILCLVMVADYAYARKLAHFSPAFVKNQRITIRFGRWPYRLRSISKYTSG
jgi:hypothetical protein